MCLSAATNTIFRSLCRRDLHMWRDANSSALASPSNDKEGTKLPVRFAVGEMHSTANEISTQEKCIVPPVYRPVPCILEFVEAPLGLYPRPLGPNEDIGNLHYDVHFGIHNNAYMT